MGNQTQADDTSVVITPLSDNTERREVLKKYLMMPVKELVRRLIIEEDSKNEAYRILIDEGLVYKLQSSS